MKKILLSGAIATISLVGIQNVHAALDPCLETLFSSNGVIDNCVFNSTSGTGVNGSGETEVISNQLPNAAKTEDTTLNSASEYGGIELNAANEIVSNNISYTPWELIHRTPMLAGFVWTGLIANFITPNMYIGTPFDNGGSYLGANNPFAKFLIGESTNYNQCLQNESFISFGLGQRIEDTDIKEFKAIAKICATEFYGPYFKGKSYTTREEFLMMLFTLFEEDQVGFQGEFTSNGNYKPSINDGSITGYSNVDKKAWYASYLKLAKYLTMVDPNETTWKTGKAITDAEATEMLALYTAYRMNFEGDIMDRGIIQTEKMKFNLSFPSDSEVVLRIQ